MIHSANRRIVPAALITVVVAVAVPVAAQDFVAGEPIGALSEAGEWRPMSDNVKVFGSFHFSESCTFDPDKNLVLAMNAGNRVEENDDDGYNLKDLDALKNGSPDGNREGGIGDRGSEFDSDNREGGNGRRSRNRRF